ncbi:MAG: serine dehydratase subunit alpha family protein [Muribaculaceae bacterium]|nr:serine dehydratase subunit alpha family protein [Muribaculaceae bacterium]
MIEKNKREEIIDLVKREVVPAIGCTEPAAVSLAVAKAKETLGEMPKKVKVSLSGNMLKNAMGVGIPGTGMIGLPIAIALGALIGKSEYGLEVLKDVSPKAVKQGKEFIAEDRIEIHLAEDTPSNLYIDVEVEGKDGKKARCVISGSHSNFVLISKDDEILFDNRSHGDTAGSVADEEVDLSMAMVWEFGTEAPAEEIGFILMARDLNKAASEEGKGGGFGHAVGNIVREKGKLFFGDGLLAKMISATSAACDARMGGAPIPVMSNSGSGNQGITATMPVVSFAENTGATEETLARALMLSHLTSIYIKQHLGRLSALCGCVVASTGAAVGLTYLMGGGYEEASAAVKNMVANLTGMLCDGAKPSCSMKISSGVSTAMMSALLAMEGKCVSEAEGIVHSDVDTTIRNLTSIGKEAMTVTDRHVLRIMTSKDC